MPLEGTPPVLWSRQEICGDLDCDVHAREVHRARTTPIRCREFRQGPGPQRWRSDCDYLAQSRFETHTGLLATRHASAIRRSRKNMSNDEGTGPGRRNPNHGGGSSIMTFSLLSVESTERPSGPGVSAKLALVPGRLIRKGLRFEMAGSGLRHQSEPMAPAAGTEVYPSRRSRCARATTWSGFTMNAHGFHVSQSLP